MNFCPQCSRPLEGREIDGLERRACAEPACGFVHWDNPIPVVAALVECDGKVVLVRNVNWREGVVSIVTGYLERREAPEAAVLREVKEELGINGRVQELIGCYPLPEKNQVILAYWVKASGAIEAGDEIAEVRLMSREELQSWDFGPLAITCTIAKYWIEKAVP